MTTQEAIKIIGCYDIGFYDLSGEKIPAEKLVEAFDMAIEALKQVTGKLNNPDDSLLTADAEDCKEQKSKLDLISRAEAIDAIDHICPVDTEYDCTLLDRVDVRYVLSDLPSAQSEIVRCKDCKHWDITDDGFGECNVMDKQFLGKEYCSYGERKKTDVD